jgi:hypothetical protein
LRRDEKIVSRFEAGSGDLPLPQASGFPQNGFFSRFNPSKSMPHFHVQGAGLGLRRSLLAEIADNPPTQTVGFYEVAPENWILLGGRYGKQFRALTERFDFVCHGLSLSLGSSDPLDEKLVLDIKGFMAEHGIKLYS